MKIFEITHPDYPNDCYITCSKDDPKYTLNRIKQTCLQNQACEKNLFHKFILSLTLSEFNKFEINVLETFEDPKTMRERKNELVKQRKPSWNKRENKITDVAEYQRQWQRKNYEENKDKIKEKRKLKRLQDKEKKEKEMESSQVVVNDGSSVKPEVTEPHQTTTDESKDA